MPQTPRKKRTKQVEPRESVPRERVPRQRAAGEHVWANIKLVFWIPYFPNEVPLLNRIPPWWQGRMNFTEDISMRALLATGNPPPPGDFPSQDRFDEFRARNEYRGILDLDVMSLCHDDGQCGAVRHRRRNRVGYTPPMSSVPVADAATELAQDHRSREGLASQVNRAINSGHVGWTALQPFGGYVPMPFPDRLQLGISAIEELAKASPLGSAESYTRGNVRDELPQNRTSGGCGILQARLGIQVNDIENVLFYMNTGSLLPYMWASLAVTLCCDGTLAISVTGSSVPSKDLYVDNVRVGRYDMTRAPFADIAKSIPFSPNAADDSRLTRPSQLGFAQAAGGEQIVYRTTVTKHPGVPAEPPSPDYVWPYGAV